MIFQLCLVIFIASAAVFESSAGNNGLDINYKASRNHADGKRGAAIVDGEGGKKLRRNVSSIADDTAIREVLAAFNKERSLVGASDMNYVEWIFYLESAAMTWVKGCDYDADFNLPVPSFNMRYESEADVSLEKVVQELFNQPNYYNAMRSNYVIGICAVKTLCTPATVNQAQYPQRYIYAVILPFDKGFDEAVPQYTLGRPCSNCSVGINWCYNNLCRGTCNIEITGCCVITASKKLECGKAPALAPSRSCSCRINLSVKFEIMLLGLLSVLFAIYK